MLFSRACQGYIFYVLPNAISGANLLEELESVLVMAIMVPDVFFFFFRSRNGKAKRKKVSGTKVLNFRIFKG